MRGRLSWGNLSRHSPSPEEADILGCSIKKSKTSYPQNLNTVEEVPMEEDLEIIEQPQAENCSGSRLFSNEEEELDPLVDLYTWDDEDEEEERDWHSEQMDNEENSDSRWPKIRVKREERIVWCKPCRRVLVLKLLGRNISYKVLNQRLQDLWGLEYGSQLIDMEGDFFIARFFSRDEYLLILKGGRGSS